MRFSEIQRQAQFIHVSSKRGGVAHLERRVQDPLTPSVHPRAMIGEGDGSQQNPFSALAGRTSPHYFVLCMWWHYHPSKDVDRIHIEVNGYVLALTPDGVIAADGEYTPLVLPT